MKTIAWDVDDVLNNLMQSWFEWFKNRKKLNLDFQDITENPPYKILNISITEYIQSLDEFRLSNLYQEMKPAEEVLEWFKNYGKYFRHIALTATPLIAAPTTAQWVFKNFGRWIRTFHFVPSRRENINVPDYDIDKSDFLKWFGKVDILVDDNEKNINNAKKWGISVILFPAQWNSSKLSKEEALKLINRMME